MDLEETLALEHMRSLTARDDSSLTAEGYAKLLVLHDEVSGTLVAAAKDSDEEKEAASLLARIEPFLQA